MCSNICIQYLKFHRHIIIIIIIIIITYCVTLRVSCVIIVRNES
jgi:hypothetical protein